jgi:hypothetical protein
MARPPTTSHRRPCTTDGKKGTTLARRSHAGEPGTLLARVSALLPAEP